jgi:hypothetical protein
MKEAPAIPSPANSKGLPQTTGYPFQWTNPRALVGLLSSSTRIFTLLCVELKTPNSSFIAWHFWSKALAQSSALFAIAFPSKTRPSFSLYKTPDTRSMCPCNSSSSNIPISKLSTSAIGISFKALATACREMRVYGRMTRRRTCLRIVRRRSSMCSPYIYIEREINKS